MISFLLQNWNHHIFLPRLKADSVAFDKLNNAKWELATFILRFLSGLTCVLRWLSYDSEPNIARRSSLGLLYSVVALLF